jgi:hypothetical protein
MYTSENALLKHGMRLATDVIFSLLEKGKVA